MTLGRKRSYATLYRTRRRQDIAALTYDCCIRTVLGSLCNALGQCRRTKTAGEQRKSALAKNEGKRERRRASTSSFSPRLLPFFFSPLSSLSWTSLLFTCYDRPLQAKLNLVKAQEMDTNLTSTLDQSAL